MRKGIWLSVWAMQKLSKPQHARQMHDMFGCQMTLVICVALWFVPVLWNDNEDCLKMPASLDILAEFWALSKCVWFVDNKFGLAFAFWLFDLQFMGILAMVGNFWPLLDVGWFTESGLQTSQPQHYKFT